MRQTIQADPSASDLFKDSCLYVGLQTQLQEWRAIEKKDDDAILHHEIARGGDPAQLAATPWAQGGRAAPPILELKNF